MARMTVVYWRDIPAQVIVKKGRSAAKAKLAERFEHGIDRAAMRAGRGGSDAYMEDWRRENEENLMMRCWRSTSRTGGIDPSSISVNRAWTRCACIAQTIWQ